MRLLVSFALTFTLSCLAASSPAAEPVVAASAGVEPDSVALLKEARAQFEKFQPEIRARSVLPLAVAECLFGDREQGRKYFAEARDSAANVQDLMTRFMIYGQLVRYQQLAGLPDDVRETMRTAAEDEKAAPAEELFVPMTFIYGNYVIDFYASLNDIPGALRFVDATRTPEYRLPEDTERARRIDRTGLRLTLVKSLLKSGRRDKAEILRQTQTLDPESRTESTELIELWIRLRHPEEASEPLDAVVKRIRSGDYSGGDRDALVRGATAYIEIGEAVEARKLLAVLEAAEDPEKRWDIFKLLAKLGDYDQAVETAQPSAKYPSPKPGTIWEEIEHRERRRHLLALGVLTAKAGKRDLSEKYFKEVEKLTTGEAADKRPALRDAATLELGYARLAAGDSQELLKAAEKIDDPLMSYVANLITAIELFGRKAGKRTDAVWPTPAFE